METIQNIAFFITQMIFFGAVDVVAFAGIAFIVDTYKICKEEKKGGAHGQADD